ncbi:MarR family winged helix-turn-helix transcriptional regulator [Candidatus Phycosocius spiralis]|uniref:MarR family transcriptional regulator n=1 Tax=Candidatus Phycosocius spiralis TaxID=2815099 RepID=A0ABQ4PXE4_9PROT|nr:MarR family transcriptional regulator [Candidatus Phycosocius spiralis]GIU67688.1 MarR family transcriptional regulator [Candidatus Phycosocius spiralis]
MKPLHLETYLPYRLAVASNKVSALIAKAYESRFDLTTSQWRILAVLSEGQSMSQQELVLRTTMDKVMVSRATATLVARDLVRSRYKASDRRAVQLSLSKAGFAIVQEVTPMALSLEQELIEAIGVQAAERLESILRKLEEKAMRLTQGHDV